MFLKNKTRPDDTYDKTKARIITDGKNQADHLYDLISATIPLSVVMLLLNIASLLALRVASYDVKGAFLHAKFGPFDERIYLLIPKELATVWLEFDPKVKQFIDEKSELYMELDRYLYRLKQSPLKFLLVLVGYIAQFQDECLYYKKTPDGRISILSVYVDDILQVASDEALEK
jgi:hypothetical protein